MFACWLLALLRCLELIWSSTAFVPFDCLRTHQQRLKKIAQLHNLVNTSQLYLIRQTDAKGLGAFATRNIQPGTIVISEPPIVVTNDESVNVAFESLNEAQKSLFMSFTRSPSSSNRGKATLSAAELVFQNNAYAWDPSNVQGLAAMFATLPRFNHHCSPNLTYQSDFENGRGTFVAIKPIATGEELCTSYCERTEPRSIRRARLQETCRLLIRT